MNASVIVLRHSVDRRVRLAWIVPATVSTYRFLNDDGRASMDSQSTTHANLFDLTGKYALVTGGTRGIGMMMARGLLQAGARVIISPRKSDACEAARQEPSQFGDVTAIPADLSRHDECLRLADLVTSGV